MTTQTVEHSATTPHQSDQYEVGAILKHSWGYDQTNIDFFAIVKRSETKSGQVWLTVAPMTQTNVDGDGWTGRCVPNAIDTTEKPIRRKLAVHGSETGVGIHRGYGWASLWSGKPAHWSNDR